MINNIYSDVHNSIKKNIFLIVLQVLKALQHFEKMNINDIDSFFQLDYLSSSLSILERRMNTTVLHLFSKVNYVD